jgi:5-oxopent-3-ene-1,2,5-tricarboxylate decarboxylase/2-hydroxyhepta-2,4-diene-1,7-dioate isomerase
VTVRIFRLSAPGHSLVLGTDESFLDLSGYLQARRFPQSLLALAATGFFAEEFLSSQLESDKWITVPPPRPETGELDTPLPVEEIGKILALGKNFRAHAAEFGESVPDEPLFFNKLPELVRASGSEIRVPAWYRGRVDHEAELAVVIGAEGRDLSLEDAMDHVAGYTVANDLTARSLQKDDREKKFPWVRGKNLDGFCPLGPCFVPREHLELANLRVRARVNGELRQDATTADWVVDVPHALAYLSRHLTLHAGDLVLMGTPEGVGPLEDGDEVVCSVEGIGELHSRIVRPADLDSIS